MEKLKTLKFETISGEFEQVNQEFMRVKIHVCYAGKNRNHSIIEKDVLDKMAETVYGVPVVGELDKEKMKFKGHGGKLEISDEGWKEVKTTIPYGFVDTKTPFTYETVLEKDGITKNEYLTVCAYLWKGRYPELVEVFENGTVKQSMEIAVDSGTWDENYDYFTIHDAHFQALCLLGVEPCFESSKATIGYSLEDNEALYKEMIEKFKQFSLEGGEEEMTDTVETQETVEVDEVVEEVVANEATEDDKPTDTVEESTSDEDVIEDSVVETVVVEDIDYEAKYNELSVEYGKVVAQLDDMKTEFERLQKFEQDTLLAQRKEQENDLFAKFETLSNEEEFIALKESADKYSLEELENMCYAMIGRKTFSLNKKNKVQQPQKLKFNASQDEIKPIPYGGILA